jgi:gliding motility-associated-like protein
MRSFYTLALPLTLFIYFFTGSKNLLAQCSSCTSVTINVNLSSVTDTVWNYTGQQRNGNCCTGSNCIRFNVTLNPLSDLLNFTVINPSPSGSAFYQINCGPQISIGTPACISNQTFVCISYCKPGGDTPTYRITATRTVQGSSDITLRMGCTGQMSVSGLQQSSIQWTSIFPGPVGTYNSYLSCTSGCSVTNVTPGSGAPAFIDYMVSGNPNTSCPGTSRDTIRVYVVPAMTVSISPTNPVICSGGPGNIVLTANPTGGAPPYTYSWSTGATTQSITVGPGSYTVNVMDTASNCPPIPASVTVVAQPTPPAPTAGANSPICEGQTLNLTASTIAGATYAWTGPNSFSSSSQNPSIPSVTAAAAGVYSVTATVNGCTGPAGTVTVTVNPIPAAPTAGSNSPICSGQNLNLTATTITGATYTWSGPNSFSSSQQNPTITGATTAASGIYTVFATVNGCAGPTATTTVTVNPTPAAPTAGSNSPICAGQTLNLTATTIAGATYSWTGPNSFSSSSQNPSIPSATTAASGIYSVTATVAGCTGPAGTVSVTVNPIPATPTASSNSPICAGQNLNLSTPTVTGATYSWTGPNSFSSSSQNPVITSATTAASGIYSVTVTVAGCTSPAGTTSVTVNPIPSPPTAGSNSPVCTGNPINLTATTIVGATYSWTGPNSFSSTQQNPTIASAVMANGGIYTVTVTVNGCVSPTATTSVTVNQTPAAPTAGSNSPVCAGQTLNLTATTIAGATYSWTGPNSFSSSSQNPSIPSVTTAAAGVYSVTATVNGCTGPAGTVTVVIGTPPPAPTAGSNSPICAGQTLNLTATTITGATYTWSGPNSFSSSNQNPSITNATTAASGIYTVFVTVGGCVGPTATTSVTVNPAPAAPTASANTPICAGSTLNLSASNIAGATYSWTGPNSFSSSLQNPSIPGVTTLDAGTYSVVATVNGCPGPAGTVTVVVNTTAVVSAGSNQTVCANNNVVTLNGSSSTGSGTWTTSGTGTFSPNANTLNATYTPSAGDISAGTVTLTLTSTNNGGCIAVTDQLTITITPAPTANAGPDVSVCSNNGNVQLNGSFTVSSGISWSTSGTGTFNPNNTVTNPIYIPSPGDTTAGSVTIVLTTTGNGNCLAVTDTMIITYTNAPLVSAGNNANVCLSSPNYTLSGFSNTGSGTWTTSGTGTFSPNANTPNATYIPSTADTTAGTVTLTFTSTNNGGCNPVSATMTITYTNTPVVTAGSNQTVCGNNAAVVLNGTSSTGSGIWTTSGSGTFTPNATTANATYNPSPADTASGSVTLTYTATNGCAPIAASITITITPAPYVNAGPDIFVCANNPNATLNGIVGGGASTGIWSTNGTGTFNPNATTLNATYIPSNADTTAGSVILVLTSTNNGNCLPVTDTLVITYTQPPTAYAGNNLTGCANNPIQLSGFISAGSGQGVWSTPNGGGTFTPSNNALNGFYTPSNSDTLLSGGVMIILTSINNGGCLASSDTLFIIVTPGPVVNAGPDQQICSNNPVINLSGTVSVASGGIWTSSGTGTFSPSNTNLNTSYIPSQQDITNGTVTLTLTSTGNGQCSAVSDNLIITFTPSPVVNAGSNQIICTGVMTVNLNGSVTGGSTTGTWTTTGTGTFSPNANVLNPVYNLSQADSAAGTFVLFLTSTNNGNCNPEYDSIIVTITSIPVVTAGADTTLCANNANYQLSGSVVGGAGTGQWTTSGSGTFTPSDTTLNAVYNPSPGDISAGSVTLYLIATNACMNPMDSLVINFTPAPTVSAGNNTAICEGGNLMLNGAVTVASGGVWTTSGDGSFAPSNTVLNPTYLPGPQDIATGSVTLYLTSTGNGNCNPVSDSLVLTIESTPIADFSTGPVCLNNTVNFTDVSTVTNGNIVTWNWNFGSGTSALQNPTFTFTTTGPQTITLFVATTAGCSAQVVKNIYVNPLPQAQFTSQVFCPDSAMFTDGSSISQGSIGGWSWNFGDSTTSVLQNSNHTYTGPGTYPITLVVTSDSGCTSVYRDTITINPCNDAIVNGPAVPTGFTPNGDGINDILYVRGGPFSDLDFRIFNEWGNEIFRSTSQSVGWDGTYKGKPQQEGTYVYTLVGTTMDNVKFKVSGDVTLLR